VNTRRQLSVGILVFSGPPGINTHELEPCDPIGFPQTVIIYEDGVIRRCFLEDGFRVMAILKVHASEREAIFVDMWKLSKNPRFSEDSLRSLNVDNAGGNSMISEMMSIEYFIRVFEAQDILLEMEVEYWIDYKMVDFVCTIPQFGRVGVSVTRAMGYPTPEKFTYEKALGLLKKKLYGLIISRNGVTKKHSFYRSILHVWCQTPEIATFLRDAYASFDINDYGLNIKGVVVLQLTVCSHPSLYNDHPPPNWNL